VNPKARGQHTLLRKYLLLKPTYRGIIDWGFLILSGIVGTICNVPFLPFSPISNIVGFALLCIGYLIHRAAHKVHKQAHRHVSKITKLATEGIYAKIRHPCYLGLLIMYVGFLLSWGNELIILPTIILSILLILTALEEEKELAKRFGKEYEEYLNKVRWRFIPGVF